MKSVTIDIVNIGLLIISLIAAIVLPFELFLFSYAFLGPLHYLTEINWLDDKTYFIKPKLIIKRLFIVFAIVVAIFPMMKYLEDVAVFERLMEWLGPNINAILLLSGFLFSMALIVIRKLNYLVLALVLSIVLSLIFALVIPKIVVVVGVFLPTIIHVYVFTLLFMLYGVLKSKSIPGIICVLLIALVPFLILLLDLDATRYLVSDYTKASFTDSGFIPLNYSLANLIGADMEKFALLSETGVKIQIFIAFAYTYHYLNWFSKTSIIGWKKSLTNKRTKYIVGIWVASVALYLYDYTTGIIALFFLSLLHVVLEFPLNVVTIKEISLAVFRNKFWNRVLSRKA
ncbi:hypothetical protein [Winogradskyella tangerina]|uniref:hypothetical protein n=1 Tax=Winogradskyella tangerina TaxID=2023240 RepID=UPI000DBE4021|nr:hypothetical protein [Winogradskyella tangerina]